MGAAPNWFDLPAGGVGQRVTRQLERSRIACYSWRVSATLQPVPLTSIPHLDLSNLAGRHVMLMPFWDGLEWHVWTPVGEGFLHLRPKDAALGDYVAERPAREEDLFVPFIDLMWQQASWPGRAPPLAHVA